jgi:hypothetical protein
MLSFDSIKDPNTGKLKTPILIALIGAVGFIGFLLLSKKSSGVTSGGQSSGLTPALNDLGAAIAGLATDENGQITASGDSNVSPTVGGPYFSNPTNPQSSTIFAPQIGIAPVTTTSSGMHAAELSTPLTRAPSTTVSSGMHAAQLSTPLTISYPRQVASRV